MATIIGPLKSGAAVERAVLVALKKRLPAYLTEAAEQEGVKPSLIKEVKSWGVASEYERLPQSNLPAVIIASERLLEDPRKDAGFYTVRRSLEVSITISAATGARARKYGQIYGIAIVGALLQRRSLGDEMKATDWIDEAIGTVSKTDRKTVVAVAEVFVVEHSNVVNWRLGPKDDELPDVIPTEGPEITEVDVEEEIQP